MMRITAEMKIDNVVRQYPETVQIFNRYGVACLGCSAAEYDNIATSAQVHGVNLDQLLRELNETVTIRN
ncbi:disulfide oxidoreductase [Candidatus Methylomirabilis limnetica]|uniref:Disulfide oxidoreductase n=2 Tax=Candidatus Methylomirabilaceae TaxID=3159504 RepID=A0A2T4TWS6_9BACT|nr:disulfide oxidoreductase [Candidatus Methylomirabilis limnetica]